jgi:hypothetical protein
MSPILEHAPLRGTTTTGADNVLWRADVGQSVQRDLSSKERVAQEASRQLTSGVASGAASSAARSGETFDVRAMGWSYESSGSQTDRALLQEAESLTHRYAEGVVKGLRQSREARRGDWKGRAERSGTLGCERGPGTVVALQQAVEPT